MAPQGWNYPSVPVSGPTSAVVTSHSLPVHTVDLSAHPPYHLPPDGFKIPNGHLQVSDDDDNDDDDDDDDDDGVHLQVGSDSGSDGDASMTSATEPNMNMMDSNRNIT